MSMEIWELGILSPESRLLIQKILIEGFLEERATGLEGGLNGREERPIEIADNDDQVEALTQALHISTNVMMQWPFDGLLYGFFRRVCPRRCPNHSPSVSPAKKRQNF